MAIPLGILAGSAALKAGTGIYQAVKGSKIDAAQSDFQIPEAYKDRMERLRMREATAGRLPGQDLIESQIGASTAQGITAAREMGNQANFANMIARSIQAEQDKLANVGIRAAMRRDELARETDAGIRDLEGYQLAQQQRRFEKEEGRLAERQALIGAGIQNIAGTADVIASAAAGGVGKGGGKMAKGMATKTTV